jgi:hypothetical protein
VLPEYWNIANQPQKRLLDLLIESASIPVVFQSRKTGEGMLSFDGGVVENVPLNKALEFNCDYVVVIYLEANRELPAQILTQIPKLRRALALQTLPLATAHKMYLDWLATVRMRANLDKGSLFHEWDLPQTLDNVICPIEPLTGLPSLIHVVPTKSLGNFVTGTLNFFSWKSRNLIQLGRRDMISTLRSFCEGA